MPRWFPCSNLLGWFGIQKSVPVLELSWFESCILTPGRANDYAATIAGESSTAFTPVERLSACSHRNLPAPHLSHGCLQILGPACGRFLWHWEKPPHYPGVSGFSRIGEFSALHRLVAAEKLFPGPILSGHWGFTPNRVVNFTPLGVQGCRGLPA